MGDAVAARDVTKAVGAKADLVDLVETVDAQRGIPEGAFLAGEAAADGPENAGVVAGGQVGVESRIAFLGGNDNAAGLGDNRHSQQRSGDQ